ncbi:MAG: sigma 54-interacting transcriptional regulator, partial [Planctomycetota bacterium]
MSDDSNATLDYCCIAITSGPKSGTHFVIQKEDVIRIGRGIDCDIVLADQVCSRVHAEIAFRDGGWWVKDLESRNGTFIGDDQITEVELVDGMELRAGNSEFTFYLSDQPPTISSSQDTQSTESIVREAHIDTRGMSVKTLAQRDNPADLVHLYELALELLSCDDPDEVLRMTLAELRERTSAEVVGYLWITDKGILKPQMRIPADSRGEIHLSQSLTRIVLEQGKAVWVNNSTPSATAAESLKPYADAVCVPVLHDNQILGAIHLYMGQGRFRDADFEVAISFTQVLAAALSRTRRQASLAAEHRRLVDSSAACADLLGESSAMKKLKDKIAKIARATGSVLIIGESGSGKELVAGAVHKASSRADRPMLAVNCAAIPANLVESQLFGHVKGSFTGATDDHDGWFRKANTGTLFLDEIGELPLEAQGKLLRILEGHPFLPVGGTNEVQVDVRVLAATNRDLRKAVAEKTFREDLYYRLSVFDIKVPPLRDRDGDIELLIDHFLDHFKKRHGRSNLNLNPKSLEKLLEYPWPGNVRQLRNVIDSAVVMANGDTIEPEDLGLNDAGTDHLDTLKIEEWEKKLIRMALLKTSGNVPEAAKLLGIGRATLYRKIDEYKI